MAVDVRPPDELVAELVEGGGRAVGVTGDVSSWEGAHRFVREAIDRNDAGGTAYASLRAALRTDRLGPDEAER